MRYGFREEEGIGMGDAGGCAEGGGAGGGMMGNRDIISCCCGGCGGGKEASRGTIGEVYGVFAVLQYTQSRSTPIPSKRGRRERTNLP